ncbi:MAG TPA: DoxX family protein, partial [Thermoanaerobaculia bacterium]
MFIVVAVLVVGLFGARLLGAAGVDFLASWPAATRAGLALMLVFTGVAHFTKLRHAMVRMMPPMIGHPMGVVYFTGLCEIAGAIGLLIPATRLAAAISLIVFFLAVLPAN